MPKPLLVKATDVLLAVAGAALVYIPFHEIREQVFKIKGRPIYTGSEGAWYNLGEREWKELETELKRLGAVRVNSVPGEWPKSPRGSPGPAAAIESRPGSPRRLAQTGYGSPTRASPSNSQGR